MNDLITWKEDYISLGFVVETLDVFLQEYAETYVLWDEDGIRFILEKKEGDL